MSFNLTKHQINNINYKYRSILAPFDNGVVEKYFEIDIWKDIIRAVLNHTTHPFENKFISYELNNTYLDYLSIGEDDEFVSNFNEYIDKYNKKSSEYLEYDFGYFHKLFSTAINNAKLWESFTSEFSYILNILEV